MVLLPGSPMLLDPGHDDYFGTKTPGCMDLSRSVFLEPTSAAPELPRGAVTPPTSPVATVTIPSVLTSHPSVNVRVTWSGGSTDWTGFATMPPSARPLVYDLDLSTEGGAFVRVGSGGTPVGAFSIAAGHTYLYRVRSRSGYTGFVSPWTVGRAFRVALVDSASSAIRFAGRWTTSRGSAFLGGSVRTSSARGATATLTFTGQRVAWIARVGPAGGTARVYLDGRLAKTVSLRSPHVRNRQAAFTSGWLPLGRHTLRVVQSSSGAAVTVDSFVVAG